MQDDYITIEDYAGIISGLADAAAGQARYMQERYGPENAQGALKKALTADCYRWIQKELSQKHQP